MSQDFRTPSPLRTAVARFAYWLTNRRPRREPVDVRRVPIPPPVARPKVQVPAEYLPLYAYLDGRYATTVVLTFAQIESILGFAPPARAFSDREWWTAPAVPSDRHADAWTAGQRTAIPNLGARTVSFERVA